MKYARLSKEQFEELHQEFINFLASQSITADEWNDIKTNKPEAAEQELDVFSDLVWFGVLGKVKYLEHISPQQIHLFQCNEKSMRLIAFKIENEVVDFTTKEGFNWLRDNLLSDSIQFFNAKKEYSDDKHLDLFKMIQSGGHITKGDLFEYFATLIKG
ncbi:DUF6495 family protein [Winogradskyella sp. UBA3174]|uniref:DUF6495 family protein n=1 Tax=Winogradskyella sp. UBA3174 TaxID=1947785 RepID=UPI0025CE8A73|nr:DUF6495 family protein [Winogradskyella sp. UBA3174]|tara:strand:- start:18693 stop:19166 length:474 start_codon:yes stop_codon:yes gene_type:complete